MRIPHTLILAFCILFTNYAFGQLTVNGGYTAQQLAENLAGPNIKVFNASLTGASAQSGTFSFSGNNFEIGSGILLTSGSIQDAIGPNNLSYTSTAHFGDGSTELDLLSGKTTYDAVTLQFDFEVQSSAISFNYIFASEEYNEYVGSNYNDVFGFFISGPGITGQENLAVVPTTNDAITINNINNNSYWQFYRDNTNANTDLQFDGFTTMLTAKKDGLIPCQVYTLKLVIADASDFIFDSGVFLKENSLVQELVSGVTQTVNADGIALEGCYDARFTFTLNDAQPTDTKITYTIGGTAINGVDYRKIDSSIIIPAGQTSATIIVDAYADGIPEPQEVIELSYRPTPCSPLVTIKLYIDDNEPIDFSLTKTDVLCNGQKSGQISAEITGGFGPYSLTLNDTEVYKTLPITGLAAGTYQVKVDDKYGCGGEAQVVGAEFDAGTTFLPDGNGNVYTTFVNISGFDPSSTLVSASQLQSVCLTLEHSFMGDVEMKLIAPDGKTIILKERPGGNNVNFGEPVSSGPVDTNSGTDITPGVGYEYCFSNDPVFQTMVEESKKNHTYNYNDNAGNSHHNEKYLPSGAYQSYQSFEGLMGSPLNGDWTIWVKDHKPNDNGYIFKWSISFTSDRPGDVVVIHEPAPIQIEGGVTKAACGAADGAINVTIAGESGPFTYTWSNGANTEDINGLSAGPYTLTVTDKNNCSQEKTFLVSNAGALTALAQVTNVSCAGGNNGVIVVTPSGGTGDYAYHWSNGESTKDINNVLAGEYTVSITDNETGCIALEKFTVIEPALLKATAVLTNEKCGDREGAIAINASGGTGGYSYTWSNGKTSAIIRDLQAAEYTVIISDENSCSIEKTFTILNEVGSCLPDCDLTITALAVNDETCGQSNGNITLAISTTNGPYSLTWSNHATTKDLSGINAGVYNILVKDKAGCEAAESFTLQNQTGSLALGIPFITNEQCGNANGGIDISVTGGMPGYTYLWSDGRTTQDLTSLSAGMYTVKVTDTNNCSFTKSFIVANETGDLYQYFGYAVDETCGNSQGSIDITIKGGVQPYSYAWTNGATSEDLKNIAAGNYRCVITDQSGCSISTPIYTINNAGGSMLISFIDVDHERCNDNSGSIELYISGGTSPYVYNWSTGITNSKVITGVTAGNYSCVVSDQNGCSVSTGLISLLDESGSLKIENIFTQHEQCADATGAIDIVIAGGTGVKTFAWSNGATTEDIAGLSAGSYSVTVTDAEGCSVNASASVLNHSGELLLEDMIVTPDICGEGVGSISLIISGGTAPHTYAWSNGVTEKDLVNVSAGYYTCTIKDDNGCEITAGASVAGSAITIQNITIAHVICGLANGSIEIMAEGGSGNYSYVWSRGDDTKKITHVSEGNYYCTISDDQGCSVTTPQLVINGNSGNLKVEVKTESNETCYTAIIDVTVSEGTAPYSFLWSNGETTEDVEVSAPGLYTCRVTDANGFCRTVSSDVSVITGTPIDAVAWTFGCPTTGVDVYLYVWGGSWSYTFKWSNGATTQNLFGLSAGTYTCVITDSNGCTKTISVNIPAPLEVSYVVTHDYCGTSKGSIDLTVTDGQPPYNFAWYKNGGWESIGSGEDLNNIGAGEYYVNVSDQNGWCGLTFYFTVQGGFDPPLISEVIKNDCGGNSGSIDLTVSGNFGPYSFLWSNGATTEDIDHLASGVYDVTITDANGCKFYRSAILQNYLPIVVSNVSVIHDVCGSHTGSIDVTLTGGSGNFSYQWNNGMETQDVDGLGEGSYTFTVTDYLSGCTVKQENIIVENNAGSLSHFASVINEKCGNLNGEIDLTIAGGSGNYSFAWSSWKAIHEIFATSEDLKNLQAGIYRCKISDLVDGCHFQVDVEVLHVESTVNIALTNLTEDICGTAVGKIEVTVTGGDNDYTYAWSHGENTKNVSNLLAGDYTLSVSDGANCTADKTFTVPNYTNGFGIEDIIITPEKCSNGKGSIDMVVTGGSGTFSYVWSNGHTAAYLENISEGTYTVTVTDQVLGCKETAISHVQNLPNTLTYSTFIKDETCSDNNGTIELTINGGSGNYSYQWSNGSTDKDIFDLVSGSFTCAVTDLATKCSLLVEAEVINFANTIAIHADEVINDNCSDGHGAVFISIAGGDGSYSYSWSNGASTQDITNLMEGAYTVTVMDGHGCFKEKTFSITRPIIEFRIKTLTVEHDQCEEGKGRIDLTMSGGSGDFSYRWSNGETSEGIFNIKEGTYTVTVTDNLFGCTDTKQASVETTPNTLRYSAWVENETCENGRGSVELTVNGGSGAYSYLWADGTTTNTIAGLKTGFYSCQIKDNESGCAIMAEAHVKNNVRTVVISLVEKSDDVCGEGVGKIEVSVDGGSGPYQYRWSNGVQSKDLINVHQGFYSLSVVDAEGCANEAAFTVDNNTLFNVTGVQLTNASCATCSNGAISLSVDGPGNYEFNWSNGKNGKDILGLMPGEYTVSITYKEANRICTDVLRFTIEVDNVLTGRVIDLYPNPSGGVVNIKNESGEYIVSVQILDNLGKEVFKNDLQDTGKDFSLDLSFLSKGNYLLRVLKGTEWISYRIAIY